MWKEEEENDKKTVAKGKNDQKHITAVLLHSTVGAIDVRKYFYQASISHGVIVCQM